MMMEPHALFAHAYDLEFAGNREEAAALYETARDHASFDLSMRAHASLRLALILKDKGDLEVALQLLEFASSNGENTTIRTHALWHLAITLLQHRPADAGRIATRLLTYDGTELPVATVRLAGIECLAESAEVEPSLGDLEAVFERFPAEVDEAIAGAWVQAAFALEKKRYFEAARAAYSSLLLRKGVPPPVHSNASLRLGVVLDSLGHWAESPEYFRRAYEMQDAPAAVRREAALRMADSLFFGEDFAGAASVYQHLAGDEDLDKAHRTRARFQLAVCWMREGMHAPAAQLLRECTDEQVVTPELALRAETLLAELHESRGDATAAGECYRRVIAHNSSDPVMKVAALTRLRALGK